MALIVTLPLAISYAAIYTAATLFGSVIGVNDLSNMLQGFVAGHLETQLPILVLLASVWMVAALVDSWSTGAVWGYPSDVISLPSSADIQKRILHIAEQLCRLASPKRIDSLVSEAPLTSILTSRASSPSPLAAGWSPSIHPPLLYQ